MTLYEIEQAILGCIDEETGEADIEALEALEMERDKKISNIACWIKSLRAESKAIKDEEKALADRRKAKENKADSLENFLSNYLNGAKFEDARCKIGYRKSEACEFTGDVNALADEYCTIKRTASLTAIKDALKQGVEIEGATLVERNNIQIK